jgi:O-antigen/teichoic acid export membrane protein
MHKSSRRSVVGAGMQSVAGRLGGKLIDFVTLLILAQLLLPADFGLIALAMTAVLLIEALTEVPLTQPILRVSAPTPDYYDTSFTLGVLRACVLAVSVTALAWPIGIFYGEPRLPLLIIALTLAPIMRSLTSPRMIDFTRVYNMWPEMIINLAGKAGAFVVVVVVALSTRSYWAIAVGTIFSPFIMTALSYMKAPYTPRLSLVRWNEFSSIVGWISLNQLFSAISFQIDRILLGLTLSTSMLGRYALASDLAGVPIQGVLYPLAEPLTVSMAKSKTPEQFQKSWIKTLNVVLCLMGAILIAIATLAGPIVQFLLGDAWRESAPILAMLALTGLPSVVGFALGPLAVTLYRPRLITQRTIVDLLVKIPLMIIGIVWFGLWGAIVARGIASLAAMVFAFTAATQLIGLSLRAQMYAIHRTVAGLVVFAAVSFLLCPIVQPTSVEAVARIILGLEIGAIFVVALMGQIIVMFSIWYLEGRPAESVEAASLEWFRNSMK